MNPLPPAASPGLNEDVIAHALGNPVSHSLQYHLPNHPPPTVESLQVLATRNEDPSLIPYGEENIGKIIGTGDKDPMRGLFGVPYETFEEAHSAAEEIAKQNGFALSIRSKRPTAINFNRAVLACSQGGRYKASHTAIPSKRRQTSTLKTGCTYKVAIKKNKRDMWVLEQVLGHQHDKHNHGMLSTGAFARYRNRLVEAAREEIMDMWEKGMKASMIREKLLEAKPQYIAVTIHDVRNALKRYERDLERKARKDSEEDDDYDDDDSPMEEPPSRGHDGHVPTTTAPETGMPLAPELMLAQACMQAKPASVQV